MAMKYTELPKSYFDLILTGFWPTETENSVQIIQVNSN